MPRFVRATLFATILALAATAPVRAGLLPVTYSVTPEAGNYRWTYAIVLPTDSQLRSGDYFTIYDFAGLIPNHNAQPLGWDFSVSSTGPVPAGVAPDDDPTLPNLTWKYSGPTIVSGQTGLGNFWAISIYNTATNSFFTATTHRTADGGIDNNITEAVVPVPSATQPNLVPEPGTLMMAGLGLPLIGLVGRLRRRALFA